MAFDKKSSWKEYYSRPEVRARILSNKKKYRSKPEIKEKEKLYREKYKEEHPDYWKKRRIAKRKEINEKARVYHNDHKEYRDSYRKAHLEAFAEYERAYRNKNVEVVKAHAKVKNAIKNKSLSRQPCENCGEKVSEAHHDDYNKPLEVRWLCKKCHMEWHRLNKAIH